MTPRRLIKGESRSGQIAREKEKEREREREREKKRITMSTRLNDAALDDDDEDAIAVDDDFFLKLIRKHSNVFK